jgi:hypothetical protein
MTEQGRRIERPVHGTKGERDLFVSPVVAVNGRLIRPNDLLVDVNFEKDRQFLLEEAGFTRYTPGKAETDFRQRKGAPPYGDVNRQLEETGAGVRLWTGKDVNRTVELVEEKRIRGLRYNHVLVGEDYYHGGPGGPPAVVPGPTSGWLGSLSPDGIADIAVLDNGMPPDWQTLHPDLPGVAHRFIPDTLPADPLDEGPGGHPDGILDKQAGHGLFICGLIARVAGELNIRLHRVLHASGEGDETLLHNGLGAFLQPEMASVKVINLSLGASLPDDGEEPSSAETIRQLRAAGKIIVASAGNAGGTTFGDGPLFPASMPEVIAVGAYDSTTTPYERWPLSCHGDVYAPGVDILSSHVKWHGPIDWTEKPGTHDFLGWARWSGTSFAAPLVAAKLTQLLSTVPPGSEWDAVQAWLTEEPSEAWPNKKGTPTVRRYDPPMVTGWI